MKRLILTIVLTLVIAGFTTNVQTAHAAITFAGGSFVNCTSSNFFGTSTGTTVTVTLSTSGVIGSASGPVSGGNFNITVTYAPQPAGTAISVTITDDAAGSDVLFGIVPPGLSCNSGGNVTFFNPGDGRVDPRPGDRIAVYCNTNAKPQTIGIILVDNTGKGFKTLHGIVSVLVLAGKTGLSWTSQGNTVRLWTSGQGIFVATWIGQYGANGIGDFQKIFTCTFK